LKLMCKISRMNMLVTNSSNTRFGTYDGFSTSLLIGESNSGSKEISIQITHVDPNRMQSLHSHSQTQCYFIISGKGLMFVDDEAEKVQEGNAIFVPSNSTHGIQNIGSDILTYLTANRAFGKLKEEELWPEQRIL